ncbi:hypothetical protein C8Q76DRAFT_795096 [Earliella scabrosa]|nr:hypothetical protein C8Q76DRAFT_795096 [Earliella scabrosa]
MASASSSSTTSSTSNYLTTNLFTEPTKERQSIDICVAGYLLTEEMVKHLCLLHYGATQADIDHFGALDFAACHWEQLKALESPYLIPMTFHPRSDPNKTVEMWLLPGKAAFHKYGTPRPKLPFDKETLAYLHAWPPPKLLKRPEFRGLRYIQTAWPRGLMPRGIILTKIRNHSEKNRLAFEQMKKDWVAWLQERGEPVPKMTPPFPVSWHLD